MLLQLQYSLSYYLQLELEATGITASCSNHDVSSTHMSLC